MQVLVLVAGFGLVVVPVLGNYPHEHLDELDTDHQNEDEHQHDPV